MGLQDLFSRRMEPFCGLLIVQHSTWILEQVLEQVGGGQMRIISRREGLRVPKPEGGWAVTGLQFAAEIHLVDNELKH